MHEDDGRGAAAKIQTDNSVAILVFAPGSIPKQNLPNDSSKKSLLVLLAFSLFVFLDSPSPKFEGAAAQQCLC
jgi:hypothetical protein